MYIWLPKNSEISKFFLFSFFLSFFKRDNKRYFIVALMKSYLIDISLAD